MNSNIPQDSTSTTERTEAANAGVFENVTPRGCVWILVLIALAYLTLLIGLLTEFDYSQLLHYFIK